MLRRERTICPIRRRRRWRCGGGNVSTRAIRSLETISDYGFSGVIRHRPRQISPVCHLRRNIRTSHFHTHTLYKCDWLAFFCMRCETANDIREFCHKNYEIMSGIEKPIGLLLFVERRASLLYRSLGLCMTITS